MNGVEAAILFTNLAILVLLVSKEIEDGRSLFFNRNVTQLTGRDEQGHNVESGDGYSDHILTGDDQMGEEIDGEETERPFNDRGIREVL